MLLVTLAVRLINGLENNSRRFSRQTSVLFHLSMVMLQKFDAVFGNVQAAGDNDKVPQLLNTNKFLDKQRLIIKY